MLAVVLGLLVWLDLRELTVLAVGMTYRQETPIQSPLSFEVTSSMHIEA